MFIKSVQDFVLSDHGARGASIRRLAVLAASGVLVGLLAGCNGAPTRDPEFRTIRAPVPQAPAAAPGSLYRAGYDTGLFENLTARRVGDILIVKLVEETAASKSAETSGERDHTSSVTNPTLYGSAVQFNAPGFIPLLSNRDNTMETTLSSSHDFDGKGQSKQSNSLEGQIAVTVAEVLPGGTLLVQGEKLLSLNQGHEHVRISGYVRGVDIEPDNTVPSTKVAGARIVYGGEGQLASTNGSGWLARFFMSALSPF